MNWLQVWGPSVLAVVVAAAFTWFFNVRSDHQRRHGIRALLSQEILHNLRLLVNLRAALQQLLAAQSPHRPEGALRAIRPPRWQRSRWDLPDVGVSISTNELKALAIWYVGLDQVAYLYEQVWLEANNTAEVLVLDDAMSEISTAPVKVMLNVVFAETDKLLKQTPAILDKRIDPDGSLQRIVEELVRRDATANGGGGSSQQ